MSMCVLSACIPEPLEVDGVPAASSDPVVSTVFIPEENVALLLSRSFGALTEVSDSNQTALTNFLIRDAEVQIAYQGKEIVLAEDVDGVYLSNELEAIENIDYHLHILDTETGLEVSSISQFKRQVQFATVDSYIKAFDIDNQPVVEFSFQDIPNEQNWYMVNVQRVEDDNEELINNILTSGLFTYILTDEGRDGELIAEDFVSFINHDFEGGESLVISLSNISEEYYNFLQEKEDQDFSVSFVSEPFNFSSNIDGGYGFFNLHVPDNRLVVSEFQER